MGKRQTRSRAQKKKQQPKPVQQEVQPKVEKKAPIAKPKQYKKSVDARQRIQRSKVQKIYLISAKRNEGSWSFSVQGNSGSTYFVYISTTINCSCMDFRMKKKPCKHIFFLITQVAQNEQLLGFFKNDTKISQNAYKVLDQKLTERLKARLQGESKEKKDIDLKDDTDCVICFTEMDKETQNLEDCGTCNKYFHTECITVWKRQNPSCPLCRSSFVIKGGEGALQLVKSLII